ncbi:MAG TPA: hypothetical protein VJ777_18305 [Mycobacterium sp.]|nr:hypothetical protein [Mycobacterium sp.]
MSRGDEESQLNLKHLVAQGSIAAVFAGGAVGAGVVPANADPWEPDGDHDEWVIDEWRGNDWGGEWRGHPPAWIDYWGFRVFPVFVVW